jgi:hypothetical protein
MNPLANQTALDIINGLLNTDMIQTNRGDQLRYSYIDPTGTVEMCYLSKGDVDALINALTQVSRDLYVKPVVMQ